MPPTGVAKPVAGGCGSTPLPSTNLTILDVE
jgi:hypothetical protein